MAEKKTTTKNEENPVVKKEAPKTENRIRRYHVSQDKTDKKWKVFLAGSDKVIKKFATQREAFDYASTLGEEYDRGVVVHSKKGKTRKMY